MSDLTLIIPAKNEKESLPKVLDELAKFDLKKNIPTNPTKPISSIDTLVLVNLIAKRPCPTTDKTIKK